jgi:O-antigen ligase
MVITVAVVLVLGVSTQSFDDDLGRFALLDRLGVVPFLAFTIAPLAYFTARQRSYLIVVLVCVGWYLGVTALLEGFGYKEMAWPSYINDPSVGIHFERARGAFVESTALGTSLLGCLVGVVIALQTWRGRAARWSAGLLVPVLLLGAIFTLTRAVWLAAAAAALVGIVVDHRTRRFLLPIALIGAGGVAAAITFIPGLNDNVSERRSEEIAVWDRLNTNAAAIEAFEEHPLVGVGWAMFPKVSGEYLQQHPDYPLTGERIEVHNVVLSRLAEIGLLGTVPLIVTLFLGVVVPSLAGGPEAMEPWRKGLLMYGTAFAVMAQFGPTTAAFPNLLLWLLAGIVASPRTTWPKDEPTRASDARRDLVAA